MVSGFWVKQREGRRGLGVSEAEWDGWKGRKRGVARLALTGDVTRMKTMIIGGAGALPYQLQ